MAKIIPTEQLILLHNKMLAFSPRHPERKKLICSVAESFGVSESTIRRQLREHIHFSIENRIDKNIPRVISKTDMLLYCQLIAALKIRTSNKKNKHLSTQACIRILEEHGVVMWSNIHGHFYRLKYEPIGVFKNEANEPNEESRFYIRI
jgi:hypothetical protein